MAISLAIQAGVACQPCPRPYCPAEYFDLMLGVTSSQGSGAITGVQVTFSGPASGTMDCETAGGATTCSWPSMPLIEGTYALSVAAPGYQTATVSAEVELFSAPTDGCGCPGATLTPSTVVLTPG